MHACMEFALAMSQARDDLALGEWLLSSVRDHWQPQGALLALLDVSGRELSCQGWLQGASLSLTLGADDFSHPLAFVLNRGQVRTWDSLYGGARIEHEGFRHLLAEAPRHCGLHAVPLLDEAQRALGVLAIFDEGPRLQAWSQQPALATLARLYVSQLALLRDLGRSQRERHSLQDSLRQMAGEEARQRQQCATRVGQLLGGSRASQRLREQVTQAAGHRLSVLIQGETGSGKEVVARLVHQCSTRASQPFVAINCAAIPENLIESELFGYQKGAFTGAQHSKQGLVAQANGGTLFLDEVGDMPLVMQAKLLRVLESHSFRPLGAEREQHSDFRLVAATHQPLEEHVREGRFRQDLYHRLCQCLIWLAPLRERPEDIAPLSDHFLGEFARREGQPVGPMEPGFLRQLQGYGFPGNVRELKNLLEVACAHTPVGQPVGLTALPGELLARLGQTATGAQDEFNHIRDLRLALQQFEASVIAARMRFFDGNRLRVAQSLNLPKRTLDHKCQKLEVR